VVLRAKAGHGGQMRQVVGVINESAQKHLMLPDQVLEQVVGAHFVALVGRVGQPVYQVKQFAHRRCYPRWRTTNGPSQLASASGRRCQTAIMSLNLALLGLFCGMLSRLYRQYW